jgi:hypothetical protein
MPNPNQQSLTGLFSQLVGRTVSGILIGPAGMHIDFGVCSNKPPFEPPRELSFWIKCGFRIKNTNEVLFETAPNPPKETTPTISSLVARKTVTAADLDSRNNSLRIVLSEELLFSAYPGDQQDSTPWIIYDHTKVPVHYFVVFKNLIESRA